MDVVFDDGQAGQVSLACLQPFEGVFACWNNPTYFQQGWVDADSGTVVWGNPTTQEILVDIAPDFLYHLLQTQALPMLKASTNK
ncbi:MAG: DUF2442 domain-containing protein [Vampirovibrionales bacterium]